MVAIKKLGETKRTLNLGECEINVCDIDDFVSDDQQFVITEEEIDQQFVITEEETG